MRNLILIAASCLAVQGALADEGKKEQDRKAILGLAGAFEVGFSFRETYSLAKDYKVKKKVYTEYADEKVYVVKNEPNQIVLQHVLQVDDTIVKHWGQVWTFEDQSILQYQSGNTWKAVKISAEEAKGTWSQQVTQIDDSPRYESYGKWVHMGESSSWTGSQTRRPLPRREKTRKKDYDYLVAVNRHTVTPAGWYHEQDNYKQLDRNGEIKTLVREIGFNDYLRNEKLDFTKVDTYWNEMNVFWAHFRSLWRGIEAESSLLTIIPEVDGKSLRDLVKGMIESKQKGKSLQLEELKKQIAPFIKVSE